MFIAPIKSLMYTICGVSKLPVVVNMVFAAFFIVSDNSKAMTRNLFPGHAAVMGCSLPHPIMPSWQTYP